MNEKPQFFKDQRRGKQFFNHVGMEQPLPGYLPILWGA